jgi:hypothetical protein
MANVKLTAIPPIPFGTTTGTLFYGVHNGVQYQVPAKQLSGLYDISVMNKLEMERVSPPSSTITINHGGAGNITDDAVSYLVSYLTANGETIGGPETDGDEFVSEIAALSNLPVSTSSLVTGRAIYRRGLDGRYRQAGIISNNTSTTFNDNVAAANLGIEEPQYNSAGGNIYIGGYPQPSWRMAALIIETMTGILY